MVSGQIRFENSRFDNCLIMMASDSRLLFVSSSLTDTTVVADPGIKKGWPTCQWTETGLRGRSSVVGVLPASAPSADDVGPESRVVVIALDEDEAIRSRYRGRDFVSSSTYATWIEAQEWYGELTSAQNTDVSPNSTVRIIRRARESIPSLNRLEE
jgi:hypothetical protein